MILNVLLDSGAVRPRGLLFGMKLLLGDINHILKIDLVELL